MKSVATPRQLIANEAGQTILPEVGVGEEVDFVPSLSRQRLDDYEDAPSPILLARGQK
jgi:hypothetical protein